MSEKYTDSTIWKIHETCIVSWMGLNGALGRGSRHSEQRGRKIPLILCRAKRNIHCSIIQYTSCNLDKYVWLFERIHALIRKREVTVHFFSCKKIFIVQLYKYISKRCSPFFVAQKEIFIVMEKALQYWVHRYKHERKIMGLNQIIHFFFWQGIRNRLIRLDSFRSNAQDTN